MTAGAGGKVTGGRTYNYGARVILNAKAKSGYCFDGWYENGKKIGGKGATYRFTATANRRLTARFAKVKQLSKPRGLKLTAKKAVWKKVSNNSGYTLKIMCGKKVIKTVQIAKGKTSYIIPKKLLKKGKTYTFTLTAKGKGKYKNSKTVKSKAVKIK